jgi:hypothetical protein
MRNKIKSIIASFLVLSAPLAVADIQYTTCYFNNNGSITYKWGLTPSSSWYTFTGTWVKTPYTKLDKFKTTVAYQEIYDSCVNSKSYYSVSGELFAIFAAGGWSTDANYPILLGGGELFPEY